MGYGSGSVRPDREIQHGPGALSYLAPGWELMQGLVCRLVAGGAKEGEEFGWSYIVKPLLPEFYRLPAIKDFFFFFSLQLLV